jgi:hypothetical protein
MRWVERVARMGDRMVSYKILVGWPEWTRPLGKPRCRRKNNIKMNLKKWIGAWTGLLSLRIRWQALVNAVMNLCVPLNAGNFLNSWGTVSFPGRILLRGKGDGERERHSIMDADCEFIWHTLRAVRRRTLSYCAFSWYVGLQNIFLSDTGIILAYKSASDRS